MRILSVIEVGQISGGTFREVAQTVMPVVGCTTLVGGTLSAIYAHATKTDFVGSSGGVFVARSSFARTFSVGLMISVFAGICLASAIHLYQDMTKEGSKGR